MLGGGGGHRVSDNHVQIMPCACIRSSSSTEG